MMISHKYGVSDLSIGLDLRWTESGVMRNFWPLRNFWSVIVCQLFCFSE